MGVLPLQFMEGTSRHTLKLTGEENFDVTGVAGGLKPRMQLTLTIHRPDGKSQQTPLLCRIDTADELHYHRNGGILPYVMRSLPDADAHSVVQGERVSGKVSSRVSGMFT